MPFPVNELCKLWLMADMRFVLLPYFVRRLSFGFGFVDRVRLGLGDRSRVLVVLVVEVAGRVSDSLAES